MKLAKELHVWLVRLGLAIAVLLYLLSVQNENELLFECIFDLLQLTASSAFEVFKIWVMMLK